jgi:hypothetical protein
MYKPLQKKSSSWTATSIQKKSKNFSKPGSFTVQPKRDTKSSSSQEIPSYSTAAADLLAENIMRGMETQEQPEVETSTVQRQFPLGEAALAAVAPPILSMPTVQTKLTIGKPGDVYEQEADQMAQQVMSMSVTPDSSPQVQRFGEEDNPVQRWSLAQSITPVVYRQVDEQVQMREIVQRAFQVGGNQASGDLESRLNASKGGGSALAPEVRAFMEPRFGADFSSVRVHTGAEAVQMNRELGSQAFAHGSDVYFGAGKSPGNNELTAHELTHVVQQTGAGLNNQINQLGNPHSPSIQRNPASPAKAPDPTQDQIVQNLPDLGGPFQTYADYTSKFVTGPVFGVPILGGVHPQMLGLLKKAESSLTKPPGGWGIKSIIGWKDKTSTRSRHAWGLAVDLDAAENPYIIGEADEAKLDQQLEPIYQRIARFILFQDSIIPSKLPSANYDSLKQESEAMQTYFSGMIDPAKLSVLLKNFQDSDYGKNNPNVIAQDIDTLQKQMAEDFLTLGGQQAKLKQWNLPTPLQELQPPSPVLRTDKKKTTADRPFEGSGASRSPEKGFLTIPKEIVDALEKVGMTWGAHGFGDQSGDIMHFDARNPLGKMIEQAKQKAKIASASATVQPKLEVGQSSYRYEREVDQVADQAINESVSYHESPVETQNILSVQTFSTPIIQRVPAPPSGLTHDPSQLKITTTIGSINYFEFIRKNSSITVDYTSNTWNISSKWSLFDPSNILVNTNTESGGGKYDIEAEILRNHVDPIGTAALGQWTLRYEKGNYYDQVTFDVAQSGAPGPTLTDAKTTTSFFNIRELPGEKSKVIGKLSGIATPVTVSDKAKIDNRIWYKITLKTGMSSLAAGTKGWVNEDGVVATVPWTLFLTQLGAFEKANSSLSLDQRITKLRQMCHKKDLPFDSIIGVSAGSNYLDQRSFSRSEWQILEGSLQTVQVPDGSKVDIYHLLVGLDVLPRRVEHQTYWNFDVGQNYSAATWSGDIGAGAADAMLGQDKGWEKEKGIPAPGDAARTSYLVDLQDRYYTTRAPETDLLGDIDAWGVDELRSDPTLDSIEKLLVAYYGGTSVGSTALGPSSGITVTTKRKTAIERFLKNYGFKTSSPLVSQSVPANKMMEQIRLFAKMWIRNRGSISTIVAYSESDLTKWYVEPMTALFLTWLDTLAKANGASV